MKIRIQDNSIRFRLTIKEIESLGRERQLESHTTVPSLSGPMLVFNYAVVIDELLTDSEIRLDPFGVTMALDLADVQTLLDPVQEGVYIRREWTDSAGAARRFIAFVEKDRPGSACIKPEAWIYEAVPGQTPTTIPIPHKV